MLVVVDAFTAVHGNIRSEINLNESLHKIE